MPGSRDNKLTPQPAQAVAITHEDPGAFLREPLFLGVTAISDPKVRYEGDVLIAAPG